MTGTVMQRFRCPKCKNTYTEAHRRTLDEMYLSEERAILALQLLIEGNSIRGRMRLSGVDGNTIVKLLVLASQRREKLIGRPHLPQERHSLSPQPLECLD
jgi:transposase-like protein